MRYFLVKNLSVFTESFFTLKQFVRLGNFLTSFWQIFVQHLQCIGWFWPYLRGYTLNYWNIVSVWRFNHSCPSLESFRFPFWSQRVLQSLQVHAHVWSFAILVLDTSTTWQNWVSRKCLFWGTNVRNIVWSGFTTPYFIYALINLNLKSTIH